MTLDQLEQISAPIRPEPKLDRYGRYVIPDPITGEERSWTRATTWASTVADTFALTKWQIRMTAVGLAKRQDLLAAVASILDPDSREGKRKLDRFCEDAKEHAGATEKATIGSALHRFAEAVDTGRDIEILPPFDKDIEAYQKAKAEAKLEVSPRYVERILTVRSLGVAGTLDRVVRFKGSRIPLIGDVKTGTTLEYSWTEIAIQLALYAHADTIFDPETGKHHRMLEVNKNQAVVFHLPAREAKCTIYQLDIAAGWEMAQVCGVVREWRSRKNLAVPLVKK